MTSFNRLGVTADHIGRVPAMRQEVLNVYPDAKLTDGSRRLGEAELIEFLNDCDAAIVGFEPVTDRVLSALPKLKIISKYGNGCESIDFHAMKRHNVRFGYTWGVNKLAVPELTICFMLLEGQIDIGINFTPGLVELVNNGSLRGIAVTTTERSKQFPSVPTVSELGFPGFESVAWYSILAPAGTPRDIVGKLNAAVNTYLMTDLGRHQLDVLDMQPTGGTPEALRDYIASEVAKWGPIIKAAGITM